MKKMLMLMLCVCVFCVSISSIAQSRGTSDEAQAMVKKAVAFYKESGQQKAFSAFDTGSNGFKKEDLYIWVSDMQMKVLSHGANSKLVGKELIELKDSDGKLFMKAISDTAKTKGSGWQDYNWTNPANKKVERKSTYFEKHNDLIFACGIYKVK